jgi:hypothetical protein
MKRLMLLLEAAGVKAVFDPMLLVLAVRDTPKVDGVNAWELFMPIRATINATFDIRNMVG